MIGIPLVDDLSKSIVQPTTDINVAIRPLPPEQNEPCVYAAYWQARSGFFNPAPNHDPAGIDGAKGRHP